jgi:hypothetical protein
MEWVARMVFFFLVGLVFSTTALLTKSILPGLPVHALGLLVFFVGMWPRRDGTHRLKVESACGG